MIAVQERATEQLSVLVVDDDPSIRDFLSFLLEDYGFRVSTASDGVEALQVVARDEPAVVVTDLMMPRMDGFELIERLRRSSGVRAIIAMSAVNQVGLRATAADAFIAKPFDPDELVAIVGVLASGGRVH